MKVPGRHFFVLLACFACAPDAKAGIFDSLFHKEKPAKFAPEEPQESDLSLHFITPGNSPTYSEAADRIAFSRYDRSVKGFPGPDGKTIDFGTYQIWTADTDGTDERCLSCHDAPGRPSRRQHKGTPTWDPSGKWLVVAVEIKERQTTHKVAVPARGFFTDLWAISADGKQWYQLTHYAHTQTQEHFADAPTGAMMPHFMNHSSKLAWSERIGGTPQHPYGIWQIAIADLTFGPKGAELSNKHVYSPGDANAAFYEVWSFSPDDKQLLINSDNGVKNAAFMRVENWRVASKSLNRVTQSHRQFEENGHYSPEGDLIAYSSTAEVVPPYAPTPNQFTKTFRSDVWITRSDGDSEPERVTYFNLPGNAQYLPGQYRVVPVSWIDERTLLLEVDQMNADGGLKWKDSRIYWLDLPQQ